MVVENKQQRPILKYILQGHRLIPTMVDPIVASDDRSQERRNDVTPMAIWESEQHQIDWQSHVANQTTMGD